MVPPGIRFNDCFFSEPIPLTDWKMAKSAGLFVILAKDGNWAPKPYQPLYFGEIGNNSPDGPPPGTETLIPQNHGRAALFISVLPMPFSTTAQRRALRNELLWAYNSTWQVDEIRRAAGIANQFGSLDKPEDATQALLLLTGFNKHFLPPPEREPRRRIGFVP